MLFASCASIRGSFDLELGHQSVGLVCSHSCIRHCAAKQGQEGNVSPLYDSCTAHDLGAVRLPGSVVQLLLGHWAYVFLVVVRCTRSISPLCALCLA